MLAVARCDIKVNRQSWLAQKPSLALMKSLDFCAQVTPMKPLPHGRLMGTNRVRLGKKHH